MRGKGEGSVYQRASDNLWCGTLELPPRDGKRRRRVITARTKRDLLEKMKGERRRLETTGDMPTASQTVEQWFTYWLANIAIREVRPKTFANYASMTKRHIIPAIGKVRLSQLAPSHVRHVADAIEAKGLSSTTGLTVHRIMSSAFTDAEREGRITRNPAKLTDAPRSRVPTLDVLTLEEVDQFIRTYRDGAPESYLWITFMLTGARRGEVLGLTWDRVTDHLDLSWQLQRHPVDMRAPADYEHRRLSGGLYLTRPKSKKGKRIVPLVDPLATILNQWRLKAPENPYGLLFTTAAGEPIDPDHASKAWPRALAAAGIDKKVRLHDLRHTAVDLLVEAGVPLEIIMEIVGHSTRAMTNEYRSRGNRKVLTDAMEKFSAPFLQQSPALGD